MAKQYQITVTVTVEEDLKEKILDRDDLPTHCWAPTRADDAVVDAVAGFAWDICADAQLKPKHMHYDIKEVNDKTISCNPQASIL